MGWSIGKGALCLNSIAEGLQIQTCFLCICNQHHRDYGDRKCPQVRAEPADPRSGTGNHCYAGGFSYGLYLDSEVLLD